MRKNILVLIMVLLNCSFVSAQYCGNSGSSQCTPSGLLTQPGFSPPPQQLSPFENGQLSNSVIQFLNFTTVDFGGNWHVDALMIDSIVGLPNGLCWSTNSATNSFLTAEDGCIRISGTPVDTPGQYKLRLYGRMDLSILQGAVFYGDLVGLKYFVRLKNTGDADNPLDTNQTVDFLPYGGACQCNPLLVIGGTLLSPDSICEGDYIHVDVTANTSLEPSNYLYLTVSDPGSSYALTISDTIHPMGVGNHAFHIKDDILNLLFNHGPLELKLNAFNQVNPPVMLSSTFYILDGVYLYSFPDTVELCLGNMVELDAGYRASQVYVWTNTLTGATVGLNNIHTAAPSNDVSLMVTSSVPITGCFRSDTVHLKVLPLPSVGFTDSVFSICLGDSVTIAVTGLNWYVWMDGANFVESGPSIVVSPPFDNTYTLESIEPTEGCHAFDYFTVNIKEPPYQGICIVTVDSNSTHNIVVWEKSDKEATDSFYVYREIATNSYQKIASIHRDSLSEFHDYSANPNLTGYRYKIALTDTCLRESLVSEYHSTIHLQYLGTGNLQWNEYSVESFGTPVVSYDVFVDAFNSNNWQLLVTVPGNQTTATDPNFSQHTTARYRVVANWQFSCTSTRSTYGPIMSNVISQQISGLSDMLDSGVWLYVNQTLGRLSIQTNGFEIIETNLYDAFGALVSKGAQSNIDISYFPKGVYIAEIVTRQGIVNKRWVRM